MKTPAQIRKRKLREAGIIKADDCRDSREGFMQHGRWLSCEELGAAARSRMSRFDEMSPELRRVLSETEQ